MQIKSNGAALTTLQIIQGALCLGPSRFAAVSYTVTTNKHSDVRPADLSIVLVMVFVAISQVLISYLLYHHLVPKIDAGIPVKERWIKFQTACLLRYVPLEIGALLNVVGFLITGNYSSLGIAVAMIAFMISMRPASPGITSAP